MKEAVECMATIFVRTFGMHAVIGEGLQCERDPDTNRSDQYVVKVRIITGHLPCKYHKPVPFSY